MAKVESELEDRESSEITIKEEIPYFIDSEDITNFATTAFVERKYKCQKCKKSYRQPENLVHHKQYECNVEPKFFCNYCDYKSKRKYNLSRHMYLRHPGISKGNFSQNCQ